MLRALAILFIVCVYLSNNAAAENWPQWRGPQANGVAPGTGYPTKWSDTENVAWNVPLPGWGTSTPAVWGDRIFATCQNDGKNILICLDRSGQKVWEVQFGAERAARNRKASGSNPSPTTDGRHVYVYYKSGELACVDFQGKTVWQKNLQQLYGEDTLWWDLGTSPVLTEDLLLVARMHSGPSYVAAFKKETGEVAWQHDRQTDAPGESAQSYTTPTLVSYGDKQLFVVLGADEVTAHDTSTGNVVWRVGGLNPNGRGNWRSIASPLISDDLVIAPYARGRSQTAIRLGGSGDVTETHVSWVNDLASDVPTPTVAGGRIYVCGDRGQVACVDSKSGTTVWSHALERNRYTFSSSPVVADGRLFLTREDGVTFVLKLGDEFELLETNGIYEYTLATPVFIDGQVLIRTAEHLYCIGAKG